MALATGVLLLSCLVVLAQVCAQEVDDADDVWSETPQAPRCDDHECFVWEDSVCAQNSEGEVCTFYSRCYMDLFNCKHGKDYQVVDQSVCDNPWTTEAENSSSGSSTAAQVEPRPETTDTSTNSPTTSANFTT